MTKILVTGASGQLGGLVIKHLIESEKVPAANIIAGTRSPEKLSALKAAGVETRKVDFDDPASLPSAFTGVDRLLIISTDAIDEPGKRVRQHTAAISAATAAKVGRIFYTSMPEPETSAVSFAWEHRDSEAAIRESGLPYTILRNTWYSENLFMALPQALASGAWYTSSAGGQTAYLAREDCARAIAAALAKNETGNAVYTLTGNESFSHTEVAAKVRAVTGKPLAVVDLTDEQLLGGLAQAGVPEFLFPFLLSVEKATREGHLAGTTSHFTDLTGRQPVALVEVLSANRAALLG